MNPATPEKPITPRAFLKARRPEKFSDSITEEKSTLDRSLLEYHLQTVTSRSQELDFENFARSLAQLEVCPNLLPHTGPSGGGDSKVDAETYPVADALSLAWFTGIGREAAQERWAFAFSAKKEWRSKLKSDVAKITATNRGYRKAFFVTNQFVPDKVRATIEDELSKKHKLDVRVLDRTWLLDKIFTGHHETMAINELKIQKSIRVEQRKGPLDIKREDQLKMVEVRIQEAIQNHRLSSALVDDCLEATELARGMELPRHDVEGRLQRAKRVSSECGTTHQQLLAAYQWAWTAFWWFEDYNTALEQYANAETYALNSSNAYELELLFNLWCTLQMARNSRKLDKDADTLDKQTQSLIGSLESLKKQEERASSSLQAETLRLLMDLMRCPPDQSDPLLTQFVSIVERSEGLVGFPLEPLIRMLTEFGTFVGERPAYSKLHDLLVDTIAARSGQVAAARILLVRGAQMLDGDHPYLAITSLGKALRRLYKHESRVELVQALYLLGNAYAEIGLKWAARGTLLTAASIAANDYWTYQDVTSRQAACFSRLRWLELQLGRLPHILAWHEVSNIVQRVLRDQGNDSSHAMEDEVWFDGCLSILLLRFELRQLKHLVRLPQSLDRLELPMCASALRFALGHDYELPEVLELDEAQKREFFYKLREQPAGEQIPELPSLCNQRRVSLKSRLLGCTIDVVSDNEPPCVDLAESILAGLEALLATGLEYHFLSRQPSLSIDVRKSDFGVSPFRFEMKEEGGETQVYVTSATFHPHKMTHEAQRVLKQRLVELLANILARVFIVNPSEKHLENLVREELAMERAVDFTSSFVTIGSVLGYAPRTSLDSWIDSNCKDYPVIRTEEWDAPERRTGVKQPSADVSKNATPDPQASSAWQNDAGHDRMETLSLIRNPLWDRAKWMGTAFLYSEQEGDPIALALMFENEDAASEIFSHWQKELGRVDTKERLRLTIICGISKSNAHAYRIAIGSNPDQEQSGGGSKGVGCK